MSRYAVTGVGTPTDLRVGESKRHLKPDPYYGMVDVGDASPTAATQSADDNLGEWLTDAQEHLDNGWRALDAKEQNRVEVMTGVRLQQMPPPPRTDLEPPDPPDVSDTVVLTSLDPASAVLGTPSFTLRVLGVGFAEGDVIVWNGGDEPTTFVSKTEVTTGVNMETAIHAIPIPIQVRGQAGLSNTLTFTFTEAAPARGVPAGKHAPKT